jgi:SAM-dependent methyltransferase
MLVRFTQDEERHRVPAVRCISEHLAFAGSSADFVTTFNAVHHFDLCQFVNEVARVLKTGGDLFIYTRTPAQNANSIWGRHFPGFISRETRLHDEATFQQALHQFDVVNMTCFKFTRRATRARLIDQVRHHHYSTFALYGPDALDDALDGFLNNIGETTEQCWQDQNLLVHARLPV